MPLKQEIFERIARERNIPLPTKEEQKKNSQRDTLLAMDSEQLRAIIKDGLIDVETEDFIDKELYIREQRMCVNVYPEPEGDPSY